MADDYGTCPNDVYDDERLAEAPLAVISGHIMVMMLADDHGLFEGNPRALARKVNAPPDDVAALLVELEQRHLIEFYEAPGRGGLVRRVGRVVDFHAYRGHPDRVSQASQRGASALPLEDGSFVPSRRERALGRTSKSNPEGPVQDSVQAPRSTRATGVQQVCRPRATPVQDSVQAACNTRAGSVQVSVQDSVQVSTAQRSGAAPKGAAYAAHVAPVAAPVTAPLGGGGTGANGPGSRRSVPEGHYVDDNGITRPCVRQGTAEYETAEREGDWKALGWA